MIKNEIEQLLSKYKHGNNSHEQRKQQNEWTTKNRSKLVTKIRFKKFKKTCCSSKLIYLSHVEIYKKQYKNNKLKLTASTWNNEFKFPDGSYAVSDIQDYTENIIKKHETLTAIPPNYVYIHRISNR